MRYALYIMLDFYNQLISGNYLEPSESLGYFHLELFYQSAAEMLTTQEQLRTNIQEVGGSFDGCRADIMGRVMFIMKHAHDTARVCRRMRLVHSKSMAVHIWEEIGNHHGFACVGC